MARRLPRRPWLQARLAVYLLIVAALLLVRSGQNWRLPFGRTTGSSSQASGKLTLSGLDGAPGLIRALADDYTGEYPDQQIDLQNGGTNQAIESLINRESDVAFQLRPPSSAEQELFRKVNGDTALWYPIALGGMVLLRSSGAGHGPLTLGELRGFLTGGEEPGFGRLYAPDPNLGQWDVLVTLLGVAPEAVTDRVIFLKDESEVLKAVQADSSSLGLGTSFTLPSDLAALGITTVAIREEAGGRDVFPLRKEIITGAYPLYHYVYAACRANGRAVGSMFVTYLTSNRGQRHVEKAGFLPTREISRPIVLTRTPIGRTS